MILEQGLALNAADALPRDIVEVNSRGRPCLDVSTIIRVVERYVIGRQFWQCLGAGTLCLDCGPRLTGIAKTGAKPFAPPTLFWISAIALDPRRGLKGHAKWTLIKVLPAICERMLASTCQILQLPSLLLRCLSA